MMWGENITAKVILAHRHIYNMKTEHMQKFRGKKVCKAKDKKTWNREFEGNVLMQSYSDTVCVQWENVCQEELLILATAATADWKVASVLNRLLHFPRS